MGLGDIINTITHKKVASEVNPVNCGDWNNNHDIVNLSGYVLVEEKILPAGSTILTFSGLDGDTDEEYLIEYDLNSGDGKSQLLYPNNDTGANYAGMVSYGWRGGVGAGNLTVPQIDFFENQATTSCKGICIVNTKSGKYRLINCNYVIYGPYSSLPVEQHRIIQWKNTIDNITSIVIAHQDADHGFSGTIRLWKRIPVEV